MKNYVLIVTSALLFIFCLSGFWVNNVSAEQYASLAGIKSVNTIFDFRDGNVDSALIHLQLIHDTYKDQAIQAISKKPGFVVVFMDVSVFLLSSQREEFSAKDQARLKEMDDILKSMAKNGVRLEVCLFAAKVHGVNPATFSPEIHRVGNGWIASLGYQQKGYSLIPVF